MTPNLLVNDEETKNMDEINDLFDTDSLEYMSSAEAEARAYFGTGRVPERLIHVDHPHTDPGDGRTECDLCGKWVWEVTHSCKGVPVTESAWKRYHARHLGSYPKLDR